MAIRPRQDKGDELEHDELDDAFDGIDDRLIAVEADVVTAQAAADAASQPGHTHPATDITAGPFEATDLVVTGEIMVADEALPWNDIIGDIIPKTTGIGAPTLAIFRDDVRWFHYTAGDDGDIVFHMPHDYAPGTDVFLHVHWAHNGTNISGSMDVRFHVLYAKGHQQADFPADKEPHLVVSGLNLTNTPQYRHRIDEIQLSTPGGSATLIDTNNLEPDGLILVHYDLDVIPTITGGTTEPFIFAIDVHYQANHIGTLNRIPDFYS